MRSEIVEVHVAYETTSEYGHKGRRVGIFRTKTGATAAADGKGWYGGMGAVEPGSALITDEGTYLLASPHPVTLDCDEIKAHEQAVAKAKAKLTSEDMRLLGIKP